MVSVDTNVLVRLLVADDRKQTEAAAALFAKETIWIAKTVWLETDWVLRSMYGMERSSVCILLTRLLGLPNVRAEDRSTMVTALAMAQNGLDLADAIHLATTPPGTAFVSFDKALVRRAKRLGSTSATNL